MRISHQQFKLQLVLHEKKPSHRKMSADLRYRDRIRDRAFTPSLANDKFRNTIHVDTEKNAGCINTISYKEKESKEFSEKCVNLLSRKKTVTESIPTNNKNNFNTMLQNIKAVIKENEKRERQQKQAQQPLCNNEFQCVRSQIHQIYAYEEKLQLYKMIRNCQSRNQRNSSCKTDKSEKNTNNNPPAPKTLVNSLFNNNAVVCFTMALNEPSAQKRSSLFQAPLFLRTSTTSACSKRVVQIGKNSASKQMNFNLNSDADSQYTKKIKSFFQFIFKVNYSNNIYVSLDLGRPDETLVANKYRVYIGRGNNSLLLKSLMKRRFWWEIVDSFEDSSVNFYWSQNIIDQINNKQIKIYKRQQTQNKVRKVRDSQEQTDYNRKILSSQKCKTVQNYITKEGFVVPFPQAFIPDTITNHLPRNYCIGSKKNLFKSLFHYYTRIRNKNPFDYIPKTYHIKSTEDQEYRNFIKQNQNEAQKVWIVKPGENSNRGRGIRLSTFKNINLLIKKNNRHQNGQIFTYIVQSYINRPFLYNNRKFDLRHYLLLTSVNGLLKAYWYKEGYIRTSSELYDLQDLDNQFIHLTNDAIQKNSQDYEKYEPANKLSYSEFQRYLDYTYPSRNYSLERDILPKMREYAADIIKANYQVIDHKRHHNNFQIFGLDFMIDRDFKPWLIEVNYNPCLEVNCPVLERIIPTMLENSLRLSLDPLFPPTSHFPASKRFYLSDNYLKNLKYELIFDEDSFSGSMQNTYDFVDQKQKQEEYQDEGREIVDLVV